MDINYCNYIVDIAATSEPLDYNHIILMTLDNTTTVYNASGVATRMYYDSNIFKAVNSKENPNYLAIKSEILSNYAVKLTAMYSYINDTRSETLNNAGSNCSFAQLVGMDIQAMLIGNLPISELPESIHFNSFTRQFKLFREKGISEYFKALNKVSTRNIENSNIGVIDFAISTDSVTHTLMLSQKFYNRFYVVANPFGTLAIFPEFYIVGDNS